MQEAPPAGAAGERAIPWIATGAALLVLAGVLWTPLLALGAVLAAGGACALALVRRPSRGLRRGIVLLALWLLLAFAGAWVLKSTHSRGLVYVLVVLFAAPAPLIPWLYARTYAPPGP